MNSLHKEGTINQEPEGVFPYERLITLHVEKPNSREIEHAITRILEDKWRIIGQFRLPSVRKRLYFQVENVEKKQFWIRSQFFRLLGHKNMWKKYCPLGDKVPLLPEIKPNSIVYKADDEDRLFGRSNSHERVTCSRIQKTMTLNSMDTQVQTFCANRSVYFNTVLSPIYEGLWTRARAALRRSKDDEVVGLDMDNHDPVQISVRGANQCGEEENDRQEVVAREELMIDKEGDDRNDVHTNEEGEEEEVDLVAAGLQEITCNCSNDESDPLLEECDDNGALQVINIINKRARIENNDLRVEYQVIAKNQCSPTWMAETSVWKLNLTAVTEFECNNIDKRFPVNKWIRGFLFGMKEPIAVSSFNENPFDCMHKSLKTIRLGRNHPALIASELQSPTITFTKRNVHNVYKKIWEKGGFEKKSIQDILDTYPDLLKLYEEKYLYSAQNLEKLARRASNKNPVQQLEKVAAAILGATRIFFNFLVLRGQYGWPLLDIYSELRNLVAFYHFCCGPRYLNYKNPHTLRRFAEMHSVIVSSLVQENASNGNLISCMKWISTLSTRVQRQRNEYVKDSHKESVLDEKDQFLSLGQMQRANQATILRMIHIIDLAKHLPESEVITVLVAKNWLVVWQMLFLFFSQSITIGLRPSDHQLLKWSTTSYDGDQYVSRLIGVRKNSTVLPTIVEWGTCMTGFLEFHKFICRLCEWKRGIHSDNIIVTKSLVKLDQTKIRFVVRQITGLVCGRGIDHQLYRLHLGTYSFSANMNARMRNELLRRFGHSLLVHIRYYTIIMDKQGVKHELHPASELLIGVGMNKKERFVEQQLDGNVDNGGIESEKEEDDDDEMNEENWSENFQFKSSELIEEEYCGRKSRKFEIMRERSIGMEEQLERNIRARTEDQQIS